MEKRTEIHHLKKGEPVHLTNNGSVPLDPTLSIGGSHHSGCVSFCCLTVP